MRYYSCGMNRAGSTWQYNVAADILEWGKGTVRAGFVNSESELQALVGQKDNCLIKLHMAYDTAVEDIRSGNATGVYIHRDLRDVAASLMVKTKRSLQGVLDTGIVSRIIRNHHVWTSLPSILIQKYENMMSSPLQSARELEARFGTKLPPGNLEAICSRYSLVEQKKRIARISASESPVNKCLRSIRPVAQKLLASLLGRQLASILARPFRGVGRLQIDPDTQLHVDHINKGAIGAWKQVMSPKEQEIFQEYMVENDWGSPECK